MDWIQLLEDHNVPYVTRGKNTKRGEVSIKCPWCGEDDPSEHMGISLTTENWGCYRDATHRGHAPHRLVAALLGLPSGPAKALARAYSTANPNDLGQALAALAAPVTAPKAANGHSVLAYPPEFQGIKSVGSTAKFWRYLASRHFDDVTDLVHRYQLQCAQLGRWKDRVIVPLFSQGQLVGWTGRAIQLTIDAPRYLSSSDTLKRTIFNEDDLREGGKVLYIVEGPFDALKIDYYGEPFGIRATCGFGVSLSIDQISILNGLKRRFRKVVILFDRGAVDQSFQVWDWLQGPNVTIGTLPDGVKDPGELHRKDVERLIQSQLERE